jgi:hypothetical protein
MLNEGITINEAMQKSYKYAKDNAADMETAARNLQRGLSERHSSSSQAVVAAFTQGCRDLAAGLIHWRYGVVIFYPGAYGDSLLTGLVALVTRVSDTSSPRSLMRIRCFVFRLIGGYRGLRWQADLLLLKVEIWLA